MAISKRIEQKKESNFISPTVDVTKYQISLRSTADEEPVKTNIQAIK
jgi:hypothetical protein